MCSDLRAISKQKYLYWRTLSISQTESVNRVYFDDGKSD